MIKKKKKRICQVHEYATTLPAIVPNNRSEVPPGKWHLYTLYMFILKIKFVLVTAIVLLVPQMNGWKIIFSINNWSESIPGCLAKLEFIFSPIKLFYVTSLGLLRHKCKVKMLSTNTFLYPTNNRSESLPRYLLKLEFKYF